MPRFPPSLLIDPHTERHYLTPTFIHVVYKRHLEKGTATLTMGLFVVHIKILIYAGHNRNAYIRVIRHIPLSFRPVLLSRDNLYYSPIQRIQSFDLQLLKFV